MSLSDGEAVLAPASKPKNADHLDERGKTKQILSHYQAFRQRWSPINIGRG
jgi:hypothetical protein